MTSSLPGIVTALALITATIQFLPPLYQTSALLIGAYVLLFLPRALVSLRAGWRRCRPPWRRRRARWASPRVELPARDFAPDRPAAAAGASLVFVAVATELTATLLLAPVGTRTLATWFWTYSSELDYAAAAPYALLLVALSIPVTFVLIRQATRAAAL